MINDKLIYAYNIFRSNIITFISLIIIIFIIIVALLAPYISPYDPLLTATEEKLLPPSFKHLFGTDQLGRDILSRIIYATRIDLYIAVSAVIISFAIGTTIGSLAGYYSGLIDTIVGRIVDTIMAFPLFVLAMGIVAALGNSVLNIIYATIIINLPYYIRFSRAEVNIRRNLGYVEAAKLSGNSDYQILFFHIVPNILPPMMVQISLNMGWSILNAAALSFIGLGIRPPTPEWGIMISNGAVYIVSGEWWIFFFPGMALTIAVFSFNMLGDGLRDLIDPKSRSLCIFF